MARSLHTPEYEYFRTLLIAAREKSGLTQSEVSDQLGRPQSFVAKYEGGERRLDVIEFIEVCRALGVDPQAVLAKLAKRAGA
ncbi:MAG: helix-turn-helix transcriptional regulator [Burkholderiaceae bacterium]|nr:helix-turn-helix transcriptional regulator [Burkholderiaceae bacterium]